MSMAYFAYGMMWVAASAAIAFAVYVTQTATPLWALLIPAMVEYSSNSSCECESEEEEEKPDWVKKYEEKLKSEHGPAGAPPKPAAH